jgi:hypothetical protein
LLAHAARLVTVTLILLSQNIHKTVIYITANIANKSKLFTLSVCCLLTLAKCSG